MSVSPNQLDKNYEGDLSKDLEESCKVLEESSDEKEKKCNRTICKKKCICSKYNYITLTPISGYSSNKSFIDYNEQKEKSINGYPWMWDDCKYNTSKIGDYFGFFLVESKKRPSGKVLIHKIINILNPKHRLKSWSKNIGQTDRNVLILSEKIIDITMDKWKHICGGMSKMGTYSTILHENTYKIIKVSYILSDNENSEKSPDESPSDESSSGEK